MTATITATAQTSATGWKVTWASDQASPTFYVWVNGLFAYATQLLAGLFTVAPGTQLNLEIYDNPADSPVAAYSGQINLFLYGVEGAAKYSIEEQVAGNWLTRYTQPENGGWAYNWKSRYLEDCQTHNFRITPIDAAGNPGTPVTTASYIVRHPDIPAQNFSYNPATQALTVAA